jgi:hypothetical protein
MNRRAAKGDSFLITWKRLYTIIQAVDEAKDCEEPSPSLMT